MLPFQQSLGSLILDYFSLLDLFINVNELLYLSCVPCNLMHFFNIFLFLICNAPMIVNNLKAS